MVRGICHTNLDDFQHVTWPTRFAEVPKVGSFVKSTSGVSLKVVSITHTNIETENSYDPILIKIELNR